MRVAWTIAWLFAAFILPRTAPADPAKQLSAAKTRYVAGKYRQAVRILKTLIRPLKLKEPRDVIQAYRLLGLCHFFLKVKKSSRWAFEKLLYLEPRFKLDPLLVPPPVVDFFEKIRLEIKEKLDQIILSRKPKKVGLQKVYFERLVKKRSYILNFFPFGVGQLQNGKQLKGYLFLGSQLAMLATNLATYFSLEGLRRPDGYFNEGNLSAAQALRVTQYISFGLFLGLVVWGIIDSLVDYKSEVVVIRKLDQPPANLSPKVGARSLRGTRKGRLLGYIGPLITSRSLQLGIGLRF